jgi:hypothetical protein
MRSRGIRMVVALAAVVVSACSGPGDEEDRVRIEAELQARAERVLERARTRIAERADSLDRALQPVPLLTGSEEGALRRYLNAAQLQRARRLGVRPGSEAELERLRRDGRLVRLPDSTQYWIVRELDHSVPLVTPDTEALLTEIGRRFQARLDSLGLPPFRLEVTSVLRTAEAQAELRRINPNAASGVSTHEFGTTLDVAYNSFAAPRSPELDVETTEAPWLRPHLEQLSGAIGETIAARRSRELQAILGRVLRELQEEGKVLVTMERRQPVYHFTVGRRLAE